MEEQRLVSILVVEKAVFISMTKETSDFHFVLPQNSQIVSHIAIDFEIECWWVGITSYTSIHLECIF